LGREIAAALTHTSLKEKFTLRGFIDDNYAIGDVVNGIPVAGGLDWLTHQNGLQLFIAIANNEVRERIANQFPQHTFPRMIHPAVNQPDDFFVRIGHGSYIAEGCVLTTNIHIGRHTLILPGCTLMPGVRITSGATIGNNVHIGPGTIIAKNTTIPSNTNIPPATIIT
jgi:serine acetyltransferase